MSKDPLYQTAIHEAGQATASFVKGKRFKDVNIRAKDDYLGRVRYWTSKKVLLENIQGIGDGRLLNQATVDKQVRSAIIISYAGYVADLKIGVDNPHGAASDFETITDIGLCHAGSNADEFLAQCLEDTKQLVAGIGQVY